MSKEAAVDDWNITDNDQIVFRVGLVTISTIIWGALFQMFRKFFAAHEAEFALRILSALHSIIDVICVILMYKLFGDDVNDRYRYEKFFLANAMGYIILDFIFCVYHDMESLIQLLNHIILLGTFSTYLFRGKLRLIIATGYAVLESTDPILQIRWMLKRNNKSYIFVEYIFIIAFIATRLGVFTYYGFHIFTSDVAENLDKVLMVLNYLMGLIFVVNILRYLVRKYQEKAEADKTKSKSALVSR